MMTVETIVSPPVTVLPVPVAAILDAPNAEALLNAYAEECLVPGTQPQRAIYEAMEKGGALQCFAAYADSGLLIGFVSVLCAIMPHHGRRLATVESLFVDPAYRDSGAGTALLAAVEQHARDAKCSALVCTARIGSAFDKVLDRRPGYALTHSQHTRWLT